MPKSKHNYRTIKHNTTTAQSRTLLGHMTRVFKELVKRGRSEIAAARRVGFKKNWKLPNTDSKIIRRIHRGTHTRCHKNGLVGDYFESLSRERNLERLQG